MRLRIHHSLGVVSLVSISAPTEANDLTMKDAFYATFESLVDQCPRRDILRVLGDFNASIGTDSDQSPSVFFVLMKIFRGKKLLPI